MKKYILIITAIFAFMIASCTKEGMEFDDNGGKGLAFVHFVGKTASIAAKPENDNSVELTVSSNSLSDKDRTYKLLIDSTSTAIEGTHFTLSSETVTIPANKYSGSVTLTADIDNLTPKKLIANVVIDSEEAIDYGKSMSVSVSLFFEITMEWLVGTWTWTDYYDGEFDDQYEVEIEQIDENTISITNIWDAGMTVEATVNYDKAVISIKPDQVIWVHPSYGNVYMDLIDGTSFSRTDPITGECSYLGTVSITTWGAFVNDYSVGAGWSTFTSTLSR